MDLQTVRTAPSVLDVFKPGGTFAQYRPGYEDRPTQITLALACEDVIQTRRHLRAEAGTGTGKSYAYLVPAILAALRGERTVVSTSGLALQGQLRDKDLPSLLAIFQKVHGISFSYAILKGLSNYTCKRNVAALENDMFGEGFKTPEAAAAFKPFVEWIRDQDSADGLAEIESYPGEMPWELKADVTTDSDGCTGMKCPFYNECFGRTARLRANEADIVVVNHALLLRDSEVRAQTDSHAIAIPDYSVLVIDEAHELESIARDNLGTELTAGSALRLIKTIERLTTNHRKIKEALAINEGATEMTDQAADWVAKSGTYLTDISLWMDDVKETQFKDGETQVRIGDWTQPLLVHENGARSGIPMSAVIQNLSNLSGEMIEGIPSWLESEEVEQWKKAAKQVGGLGAKLARIVTPGDVNWIRYATLEGRNGTSRVTVAAKPISVSEILNERFFSGDVTMQRMKWDKEAGESVPVGTEMPPLVTIAMSATLATDGNCQAWGKRVGLYDAAEVVVDSPFNYRANARFYVPTDPGLEPRGAHNGDEASARYLDAVAAHMKGLVMDAQGGAFLLFTSTRAMNEVHARIASDLTRAGLLVVKQGDMARGEMTRRFVEDGNAVLFGLRSFWQGVDIVGHALRLVVMDKMPFNPPSDVVWNALCEDVNRKAGDDWAWWNELAIPFMITQLKQGFGRLIRTGTDRGIVALLDLRIHTKGYGKRIVRSMPPAPMIRTADEVATFWSQDRR
jgi:ATP-dependent DNA helicase DinG